jgi:MoCo/4Fe-4S cofactor protein with predicted Tat translocation signal
MYRKDLGRYWQGLDELGDSQSVRKMLEREFPVDASVFESEYSRRQFLKVMGASLALAGVSGCHPSSAEKIVTAVRTPEGSVPGKSIYYARSLNRGGSAMGVLVETYMGRPIKIEGNPDHPITQGATDVILQAEILNLYDPDRLKNPQQKEKPSDWPGFSAAWNKRLPKLLLTQGQGLRFLYQKNNSETFKALCTKVLKKFPRAKFISYDPLATPEQDQASVLTFGKVLRPFYQLASAEVILSFGEDFLSDEACGLKYARDFTAGRKVSGSARKKMNRLYVVEADYSLAGAMADHRLPLNRYRMEILIELLAVKLGVMNATPSHSPLSSEEQKWLEIITQEFRAHAGSSLIMASPYLSAAHQSLIFLMNEKLSNTGATLNFITSAEDSADESDFLSLIQEMRQKEVKDLIILSGNPLYSSPADLNFAQALAAVEFSACLSDLPSETSVKCHWQLPMSHQLECWSDGCAKDGTLTINQALINPLYQSKNELELLSLLLEENKDSHQLVKEHWSLPAEDWQKALSLGLVAGKSLPPPKIKPLSSAVTEIGQRLKIKIPESKLELHFAADPYLRDGTYANNGWLQELPKPISKTCWGNAAFISPALAAAEELSNQDVILLTTSVGKLEVPVWIMPGLAKNIIQLHFGHGRGHAGRVGNNVGSNAYLLWSSKNSQMVEREISFKKTGKVKEVACTQLHHKLADTGPLKVANIAQLPSLKKNNHQQASLYPEAPLPQSEDYAWGMTIDLNTCIGCNACVIACQAENNIPIVGEEQVKLGREMHWLRVDRYFEGGPDFSKVHFQPLACVHCEKAPCELVCPVAATTHSDEGINQMVYNRCVGTRYCSNNCPYKVRRFNFLEYHDRSSSLLKMRSNPEVTVRSRGVMEKCTYCIQRISEKKITADLEERKITDGEIKTACQQVCPTKAIVFGNLKDPKAEVTLLQQEVASYELLGELGTKPRTQYLMRFKNPHPELS